MCYYEVETSHKCRESDSRTWDERLRSRSPKLSRGMRSEDLLFVCLLLLNQISAVHWGHSDKTEASPCGIYKAGER